MTALLILSRESHTLSAASTPNRKPRPKKPRESRKEKKERLARLTTQPVPVLFQHNPFKKNKSLFTPKSYTENVEAFCETARKRRSAIFRNLKMTRRRFSHMVTINLCDEHHPAIINKYFRRFAKHLTSRGLDGHWTIEINKKNLVHWHLLFLDFCGSADQLKSIVTRSLNEASFPRFRVHSDKRRRTQRSLIDYCLKVMKPGCRLIDKSSKSLGAKAFSISVPDIYEDKRVLFQKGTGLDKHGTFGRFWAEGWNEKKFRKQIQSEAIRIEENLKDPRVRALVVHMHKTLGISLKTAKWSFALNPYTPESEAVLRSLNAEGRSVSSATQHRAIRRPPITRSEEFNWIKARRRKTPTVCRNGARWSSSASQHSCSVVQLNRSPSPSTTGLAIPLGCSP